MATLEGANAYFAGTLREESWNDHEAQKQAALNDASSMISRLVFSSRPPTSSIDNAIYEQAYCLLEMPLEMMERQRNILSGMKSFTASKYSETLQDADTLSNIIGGIAFCPAALSWLSKYLAPKTKAKSGKIMNGRGYCG
ncbi:hypothetical protein LJC42_00290 [Eubacteriales bacterium OttesenSCG-928-K08]|nr:hypothetical protein [Eubacteriales bacterium OttesenSCG-928-K08]